MSLHNKKDFAKLCFTTTGDLSNYIKRGNVIIEGEWINDADEINIAFIEKRKRLQELKELKEGPPVVKPIVADQKKEVQPKFDFPPEHKTTLHQNFQMDGKIKTLTLEKTQNEIELQNLKIQKQRGDLVPTEAVKSLVAQHSKSITIAYRNATDNFLMEIAKKTGMSVDDVGLYREKLTEIINRAVMDSIEETTVGLKTIVDEYSQKRGVGEKD